jgi:hypothetical protein
VASLSIATEQAASDRSYGLGLQGSHNTSSAYYLLLMYAELRTSEFLHKKPRRTEPGLCKILQTNFAVTEF